MRALQSIIIATTNRIGECWCLSSVLVTAVIALVALARRLVNETAARMSWRGDDPGGRTIRYFPQETSPSIRIVGIVGDVRSMGPPPPPPAVYVPYAQAPREAYEGRTMTFVVRFQGNPAGLAAPSRAAVALVDPSLPLANLRSMSEVVAIAVGSRASRDW